MTKEQEILKAYRILLNLLTTSEIESLLQHAEGSMLLTNGTLKFDVRKALEQDSEGLISVDREMHTTNINGERVVDRDVFPEEKYGAHPFSKRFWKELKPYYLLEKERI